MFTINNGKFDQVCCLKDQVGKNIVIDNYLHPDQSGKEIAKRIGKIVAYRQVFPKYANKTGSLKIVVNLITVEYQEDNHYAEKTISAYHLDRIKSGVILSA